MKNNDKISIVVPVYNGEKYVEKCITSIINQTYKNIEIIIVNDGSTDNTVNVILDFMKKDERVKMVDKINTGTMNSRIDGLKVSTGRYVMFVDSDDFIANVMIEIFYNKIKEYKSDIVRGGYTIVYSDYKYQFKPIVKETENYSSKEDINTLYKKIVTSDKFNYIYAQLINIDIAKKIYNNERIDVGEDLLINLEMYNLVQNITLINDVSYYYCYNPQSVMNYITDEKLYKNLSDLEKVYYRMLVIGENRNIISKKVFIYIYVALVNNFIKILGMKGYNRDKKFFETFVSSKIFNTIKTNTTILDVIICNSHLKLFMIIIYTKNYIIFSIFKRFLYRVYSIKIRIKDILCHSHVRNLF